MPSAYCRKPLRKRGVVRLNAPHLAKRGLRAGPVHHEDGKEITVPLSVSTELVDVMVFLPLFGALGLQFQREQVRTRRAPPVDDDVRVGVGRSFRKGHLLAIDAAALAVVLTVCVPARDLVLKLDRKAVGDRAFARTVLQKRPVVVHDTRYRTP